MTGFLASYWYYRKRDFTGVPGPLILDSGAFSAYTQGGAVDLLDLARFYRRVYSETAPDVLQWAVSLDVMGEHSQSLANYLRLRDAVPMVQIVPVVHFTSPLSFEDQITPYLEAGATRVCFGGMVGAVHDVNLWAAHGLRWLRDNSPETLTHGLGVGPWVKRARLPWDSTDCSDFGLAYRFGVAKLPHPQKAGAFTARIGTGFPPSRTVALAIRRYGVEPRECTSEVPSIRIPALARLSFRASEHEEQMENTRRARLGTRPVLRYVVDGNFHSHAVIVEEMNRALTSGPYRPSRMPGIVKPLLGTRPTG